MANPILRLTWDQTHDYFDIEVENPDFSLWFVEQCNNFGNSFVFQGDSTLLDTLVVELRNNIQEVNCFLRNIHFPEIPIADNVLNQSSLNIIHKNWIRIVRQESKIDKLFYFASPDLFQKFHDINLLVHKIEKKLNYHCLGDPYWRVENKFHDANPCYGRYNVFLNYTDWGKSSWHKFRDGDNQPNDFELSNWNTIGSDICIDLCRPYKLNFSSEYLDYCLQNQIDPTVKFWPLGNLVDYQNTAAIVGNLMNKNVQIANNKLRFSFVI